MGTLGCRLAIAAGSGWAGERVGWDVFLHVTGAQHIADHRIRVSFNDGTNAEIDLSDSLGGPIFEPLRDVGYFKSFSIIGTRWHGRTGPISPRSTCIPWPQLTPAPDLG
jgi:hypothetical protein